jgi:hypothetical protein
LAVVFRANQFHIRRGAADLARENKIGAMEEGKEARLA